MSDELRDKLDRLAEIVHLVKLDQQNLQTVLDVLETQLDREWEKIDEAVANNIITAYNLYRAAQYEWRYKETNQSRG